MRMSTLNGTVMRTSELTKQTMTDPVLDLDPDIGGLESLKTRRASVRLCSHLGLAELCPRYGVRLTASICSSGRPLRDSRQQATMAARAD